MKKILLSILTLIPCLSFGQQLPFYTQYSENSLVYNPAVSGVKRILDARMNYRMQWVGFDGAPITQTVSVNGRLLKGSMGVSGLMYKDQTGPTSRNNYTLAYAYHVRFPDLELSLGLAGSYIQYTMNTAKMTIHEQSDKTVDLSVPGKANTPDASAGVYLYNDRFHLGLSAVNLISSKKLKFYTSDTSKKSILHLQGHYYATLGYNYSGNPNFIWENELLASYVPGAPSLIVYSLKVHYKQRFFFGASLRIKDAVAIDLGMNFKKNFQVSYSYDIITSALRSYNSGSHEIMLVYSTNLGYDKKKADMKEFTKRKYGYMF